MRGSMPVTRCLTYRAANCNTVDTFDGKNIYVYIYIYNIHIFIDLPPKLNSTEPWLKVIKYHKFIFFSESTVTNPAIWLALSAVSIPISAHGHGNAFPSTFQSSLTFFQENITFFRLGSIFKRRRRSLPQANK